MKQKPALKPMEPRFDQANRNYASILCRDLLKEQAISISSIPFITLYDISCQVLECSALGSMTVSTVKIIQRQCTVHVKNPESGSILRILKYQILSGFHSKRTLCK